MREAAARRALDRTARQSCARDALLALDGIDDDLLDSLEADHYLDRDGGNRLKWKYSSLARLWIARRGQAS